MARDKAWAAEFHRRMEEYDASHGIGRAAPLPAEELSPHDTYGIEARARREWESSAAIREEFTCLEAFVAFKKAEAKGLVRIISRKA